MKIIKPIPLTEELLVKFDILTSVKYDEPKEQRKVFKDVDNKFYYVIEFTRDDGYGGKSWSEKHIQYIHQLQNLYFALTGEELTIKK